MQAESRGFLQVLGDLGPWIISGIALAQVWVLGLWKRLRRGVVEIHSSGLIEVGYSRFGPTVGIFGTLQAVHRSVFIETIYLEVTRTKDGARHEFGWRAIRPNTVKLAGDPIDEVELPSSFLLRPEEPFRFNILFNDAGFVADLGPSVNPLPGSWWQFRDKRLAEIAVEHESRVDALLSNEALMEEVFKEFNRTDQPQAAWKALNEAFYWVPGDYEMTMRVRCRRPEQEFVDSCRVALTEDDSEQLRQNSVSLLRSVCGLSSYFHFSHLARLSVEKSLPSLS